MNIRFRQYSLTGFTLVELAIVLVIIGLVVGAVLVGTDLIETTRNRSQISQMESYLTAAHTFQEKYGKLPGDLPTAKSDAFGFARSYGNGDGLIHILYLNHQMGEPMFFWRHLSEAGLISENLVSAVYNQGIAAGKTVDDYFPRAKLGNNNSLFVWAGANNTNLPTSKNYLTINGISGVNPWAAAIFTNPGSVYGSVKVSSAYYIDTKMDDGIPVTGKITTRTSWGQSIYWTGFYSYTNPNLTPNAINAAAWARSYANCFDNNNTAGQTVRYSMTVDGGRNHACIITLEW